jgi:ferritin-like metal-binding protein YciE
MEMETLRDLYIDELKDLYSAEKQLLKALPKMAKAASSPELKQAFQTHLQQTEQQVARLEQVFEGLEASPRGKKCVGMEGLIEEAQELIGEDPEAEVLDAGLISKAQHVEHYEIAGYGTVRAYALLLGEEEQAQLLQETLDEEGETDKLLTELAETAINLEAAMAGSESEAEDEKATSSRSAASKRSAKGTDREVSRGVASDTRAAGQGSARSERSSGSKRTENRPRQR